MIPEAFVLPPLRAGPISDIAITRQNLKRVKVRDGHCSLKALTDLFETIPYIYMIFVLGFLFFCGHPRDRQKRITLSHREAELGKALGQNATR